MENLLRPLYTIPKYRLFTKKVLKEHSKLYKDTRIYIKEAIKAVKAQISLSRRRKMISYLNTNLNHNDGSEDQFEKKTVIRIPMKNNIRKRSSIICPYQRKHVRDYGSIIIKDKIKTPLRSNQSVYLNQCHLPYTTECKSKDIKNKFKNIQISSFKTLKYKTTSNNADCNYTRAINTMYNSNFIHTNNRKEKCNFFNEENIKKERKENIIIPYSVKKSLDQNIIKKQIKFKIKKIKKEIQMDIENISNLKNKTKETKINEHVYLSSLTNNALTKVIERKVNSSETLEKQNDINIIFRTPICTSKSIMPNSLLISIANQLSQNPKSTVTKKKETVQQVKSNENQKRENQFNEKMKEKLLKFEKINQNKNLKRGIDNGKESTSRIFSRKPYCKKTYQILTSRINRYKAVTHMLHMSKIKNQIYKEFNPIKIAKAKIVLAIKIKNEQMCLITMSTCSVTIRLYFPLNYFNSNEENVMTKINQEYFALSVTIILTAESTTEFMSHLYSCITNHKSQKQYLLERITNIHKITLQESNLLIWSNCFEDSWDMISETISSSYDDKETNKNYKDLTSDSLCNSEDVYGSDYDIEEILLSGDNFKYIYGNSKNFETNLFPEKCQTESHSPSESTFTTKYSVDEYEILTCHLSTEHFKIFEKLETEFKNVLCHVNAAFSTKLMQNMHIRKLARIMYHCPISQNTFHQNSKNNTLESLVNVYTESMVEPYSGCTSSFFYDILVHEIHSDTMIYYSRVDPDQNSSCIM